MRIAETAARSDPGRTRRHNEDSFVLDPPLFAVCDGMGGAQAGEVASGLAAAALREFREADALSPEERVAALVHEANRRVYERAQGDTLVSGMGTTTTAVLVEGGLAAVGHVGDSRAYRLRDGGLEQLTDDHSLVGDLVRSGQLTREEADVHPQRSVITRALGTDPDVDVDTFTVELRDGDLLLLCSDGLTSMVAEDEVAELLRSGDSLDEIARHLVRAANRRGGEDNITVVLARLEADSAEDEPTAESLEDTLTALEPPRAGAPPGAPPAAPAQAQPTPPPPPDRGGGLRWSRGILILLVGVALALAAVAGALWGVSRANFVGVTEDGRIAVYQGVPWDLGGGINLYRERYVSQVRAVQLSPEERAALLDHDLTGYEEARDHVRRYEAEAVP